MSCCFLSHHFLIFTERARSTGLSFVSKLEVPYTHMGCLEDDEVVKALGTTIDDARVTPSTCRRVCYLADYRYAALSSGNMCHCGYVYIYITVVL